MKHIVKILCLVLVFVLLFTGCIISEDQQETTASQTLMPEKETITETAEEETTTKESGYLNVLGSDLERLRSMLCGHHYKEYDSAVATEANLLSLFTDGFVCQGLIKVAKSLTNFPDDAFSQYAVGDTPDPMEIFTGSYVWIREDMFDFISQNIWGVTFSHEFDETKESNNVYYYYNGYFYFSCMITGLEVEDILINDCVRQDDGRYLISTELVGGSLDMDGEIYHKAYGDILAGVVEKDGVRYWEISEIHINNKLH